MDVNTKKYYMEITENFYDKMKKLNSLEDQVAFMRHHYVEIKKILQLGNLENNLFYLFIYPAFTKKVGEISQKILLNGDSEQREVIKNLFRFSNTKELIKVFRENDLDISMLLKFKDFAYLTKDKEFVIEVLKSKEFSLDRRFTKLLIQSFKEYFYDDSEELRRLIFRYPVIYKKLAEAGLKPNLPNEVVKKFVSILGAEYFVTRLNAELKENSAFMYQIIIENPIHLFRGTEDKYLQRIRENAFALFGDSERNILEIYGMGYILENASTKFLDFYEYIKVHGIPDDEKIIFELKNKMLTPEEQIILKLRYKISQNEFNFSGVPRKDVFKQLLRANFNALKISYHSADLERLMAKYHYFIDTRLSISEIMPIINNIAVAIKNGTLEEFDEMVKLEGPEFASRIDMNVFTREVIDKIGLDNISKLLYYPNSSYILSQIVKEGTLDLYANLLSNRPKSNLAPAIDVNVLLYSCYMYKDAIIDLQRQGRLDENIIRDLIDITRNNHLLKIEKGSDITNYYENLKRFCDEEMKKCQDVPYAKELLFARLLKTDRANAQEFIIKYKDGLKEKKSINYEILELLEIVDSLQDLNAIKNFYKKISKFKIFQERSFKEIDERFKREVLGDQYIQDSSFHIIKDPELEEGVLWFAGGMEKTPEIIVLDPEKEFQVLAHCLGAFGNTPDAESIIDSWNTKARSNMAGICTSLITNEMFKIAGDSDSIILGFNKDVSSDEVLMCAPYDMWSRSGRLYPDSRYCQSFITPDRMVDEARGARGRTSEIVISRYNNEEKRQPDYILFFLTDLTQKDSKNMRKAMETALSFNVPIVLIDVGAFFKKALSDLNKEEEDYRENPSLDKAKKLYVHHERIREGFDGVEGIKHEFKKDYAYEYELIRSLPDKDCSAFVDFVKEEREKKKVKNYEKDQEKLMEKGISKSPIKIFQLLRDKQSLNETRKLASVIRTITKIVSDGGEKGHGK